MSKISIKVTKSDLKKVLSAHKRFALQGKDVEYSVLSSIKFQVTDDELILTTTNGDRALISNLSLLRNEGDSGEFILSMALVSKLALIKNNILDEIIIKTKEDTVEFVDEIFNSVQVLPKKTDNYPEVEKLIDKNSNFTIRISQKMIYALASLKTTKLGYLDISFNTSKDTNRILVETATDNVKQKAIIMPMVREQEDSEE